MLVSGRTRWSCSLNRCLLRSTLDFGMTGASNVALTHWIVCEHLHVLLCTLMIALEDSQMHFQATMPKSLLLCHVSDFNGITLIRTTVTKTSLWTRSVHSFIQWSILSNFLISGHQYLVKDSICFLTLLPGILRKSLPMIIEFPYRWQLLVWNFWGNLLLQRNALIGEGSTNQFER